MIRFQKQTKLRQKYPNTLREHKKTRPIEVVKPIFGDNIANQIIFGCGRKNGGPFFIQNDLEFAKTFSGSANVQKKIFEKLIFKP